MSQVSVVDSCDSNSVFFSQERAQPVAIPVSPVGYSSCSDLAPSQAAAPAAPAAAAELIASESELADSESELVDKIGRCVPSSAASGELDRRRRYTDWVSDGTQGLGRTGGKFKWRVARAFAGVTHLQDTLNNVARFFNRTRISAANKVDPDVLRGRVRNRRKSGQPLKAWDPEGVISLGFRRMLGVKNWRIPGVSNRSLDALASCGFAFSEQQDDHLKAFKFIICFYLAFMFNLFLNA